MGGGDGPSATRKPRAALEPHPHLSVRHAALVEFRPLGLEAAPLVEDQGMGLGMKNDFSKRQSSGLLDECFECDAPQSMLTMGSQHRHATDARAAIAQGEKPACGQGVLGICDEQVSTD